MFWKRVVDTLTKERISHAIAGGFAVALHGALRGTVDLDLVIRLQKNDFLRTENALKSIGLVSKLPVDADQLFSFREEYIKNRNLVAWNFVNPDYPLELVDIIITHDVAELNTETITYMGSRIKVLSIESLIQMKQAANRPQDQEDIKALEWIRRKP